MGWLYFAVIVYTCDVFPVPGTVWCCCPVGGYLARHLFRKHGQIFNAAHASWQINTVWLTLLLGILAVVAVIAIGAWMGNEPFLEARLDAIINSDLAPIDGLRAIWNIPGVSTW